MDRRNVHDGKKWYRSPSASDRVWDGKWHHFAGSYDGKKVHLYVDGVEVGTGTAFSGNIKYDSPVGDGAIGAYRGGCKLTLSGTVDEVRIWADALPVAQIWSLISSGLGREPVAPNAKKWFAGGL